MAYKILIVDDEVLLTQLLADHLRESGYLPYTAHSGEEALEQLTCQPDLILLDINLPGTDGLALCRAIRDHVACPILFLTARITEEDQVVGFQAGGDDYITKPFGLQELTARIAAHLRRDARARGPVEVLGSGGLLVDLAQRKVLWQGTEIPFSKRELAILEFLMAHPNQVFDRERIYERLWGYEAQGDSGVVKEHVRKIRAKLLAATGRDYIETVWGMGYRWKP